MSSNGTSNPVSTPHLRGDGMQPTGSPVLPRMDVPTSNVGTPLASKCARPTIEAGICCKELKKEERTLIDPDVVRDAVIGLSDGLTVPFALAAGLSSLGESKYVVLAGIAELIAGCISMGIGGFLASQSERDHYRYLRQQTAVRVERSCAGEMDREVAEILSPVGVSDKACSTVAQSLREAEEDFDEHHVTGSNGDLETASLRWSKEVGLTAFFLKFGKGMEEVPDRRLYISAFTIGMGYLLGGLIPLLPYFFIPRAQIALIYSSVITGIVLLIFGAVKSHVTGAGVGTYGYVYGAVSTLFVGGLAAGAAFAIVRMLET